MPWFSDHAGPTNDSRITPLTVLPSASWTASAPRSRLISRLNNPAYTHPYQRFAAPSRDTNA